MTEVLNIPTVCERVPEYAHSGDAGADLVSTAEITLEPGARALVPTGVSIALPEGYGAFVMPRSGLAVKHGVTVLNGPGVVDAGYRGEIRVALVNTDREHSFTIEPGDRIAQLVILPVVRGVFTPVTDLPDTERGSGGFGSTGVQSTTSAAAGSGAPADAAEQREN